MVDKTRIFRVFLEGPSFVDLVPPTDTNLIIQSHIWRAQGFIAQPVGERDGFYLDMKYVMGIGVLYVEADKINPPQAEMPTGGTAKSILN